MRTMIGMYSKRIRQLKKKITMTPSYYYDKKHLTIKSLTIYYIKYINEYIEDIYGLDIMDWIHKVENNRFKELEDCFKTASRIKNSSIFKNKEHSEAFDCAYFEVLTMYYEHFILDVSEDHVTDNKAIYKKVDCLEYVELLSESISFLNDEHVDAFIEAHHRVFKNFRRKQICLY